MTDEHPEVNPASEKSRFDYHAAPVLRAEHREGTVTRLIEQRTATIPSDVFLFAALGSMGASFAFELAGKERVSHFLGMWAPALLTLGVYNKLVKIVGPS